MLAYFIGRFVADTLTGFLASLGFDQVFVWLGLPTPPAEGEQTAETQRQWRQPSEIAGIVVLVGIVLVGAIAAVEVLEIPALTAFVSALLVILGQVLVGIVIFAVGLYLANLAFRVVAATGGSQARFLAQAARIAILAFVGAMALQQMGHCSQYCKFGLWPALWFHCSGDRPRFWVGMSPNCSGAGGGVDCVAQGQAV